MTRRERMEARAERRTEWAGKAAARSESRFDAAHALADRIPLGQPILVGHHSEAHARRDADRIASNMTRGVEAMRLAEHHESKARGIAIALERSVFADDDDAIAKLEARIVERETEADRAAALNKAWRKGGAEAVRAQFGEKLARAAEETMRVAPWLRSPLDTTNTRAAIRRDRERIVEIRAQRERGARAEQAGGCTIGGSESWAVVTFAAKPERAVLEAMRAAGFRWSGGAWQGSRERLPVDSSGALLPVLEG